MAAGRLAVGAPELRAFSTVILHHQMAELLRAEAVDGKELDGKAPANASLVLRDAAKQPQNLSIGEGVADALRFPGLPGRRQGRQRKPGG